MQIEVNGEKLVLDRCGAAFLPDHRALIFADLHLEKGSSFARNGQLLPPYDTATTLLNMARAMSRYRPARVIALGDSFHDGGAGERMGQEEKTLLCAMSSQWVWILGNHDPKVPSWLGGVTLQEFRLGQLTFRHQPSIMCEKGEVAGHLHPCAKVTKWGRSVRRRCFVSDGSRMILPAFGAYTGGLDVGDRVIGKHFGGSFHAYMLGQSRVFAIAQRCAI